MIDTPLDYFFIGVSVGLGVAFAGLTAEGGEYE